MSRLYFSPFCDIIIGEFAGILGGTSQFISYYQFTMWNGSFSEGMKLARTKLLNLWAWFYVTEFVDMFCRAHRLIKNVHNISSMLVLIESSQNALLVFYKSDRENTEYFYQYCCCLFVSLVHFSIARVAFSMPYESCDLFAIWKVVIFHFAADSCRACNSEKHDGTINPTRDVMMHHKIVNNWCTCAMIQSSIHWGHWRCSHCLVLAISHNCQVQHLKWFLNNFFIFFFT